MKIGVLALQGEFLAHERRLAQLDCEAFEIRQQADWDGTCDGLILPGGESTVIGRLLRDLGLLAPIRAAVLAGLPVFGTCAGLILLAQRLAAETPHLATMDIAVKRNGYGRQLGSFATTSAFGGLGELPMIFIRAPYIEAAGDGVEILARVEDRIVGARQGNQLVTAFHPELGEDTTVHRYFLQMAAAHAAALQKTS